MLKTILIFIISSFFILGCNQPEKNPETKDLILQDLNSELGATKSFLAGAEKQLEDYKKELSEVKPQTGATKRARDKVEGQIGTVNKLKQEQDYLNLRIASRTKEVRKKYFETFRQGGVWDPAEGFEDYKTEKKLRLAKKEWDVKSRMKELGIGDDLSMEDPKKKAEGEKSKEKKEEKKE